MDQALLRAPCRAAELGALYDGFDAVSLQYGPGYRTLEDAWGGTGAAFARLRVRARQEGTQVHPADLDDALCVSALITSRGSGTRLPFAVDEALLQGGPHELWALVGRQRGPDAVAVRLGTVAGQSQAQLDGFKSRALRAESATQRHLYATEWRWLAAPPARASGVSVLVVSDESLEEVGCERLGSAVRRDALASKLEAAAGSTVLAAVAPQRGQLELDALFALEVSLALVQAQAATSSTPPAVWLLTTGATLARRDVCRARQAGSWGLARSARGETLLPLLCIDAALSAALDHGSSLTEPEAVLQPRALIVPRLVHAPRISMSSDGAASPAVSHVVTGGTAGLGLLTGRWLAQRGARALALASRSGTVARDSVSEWEQLEASGTAALVERCDTAEAAHVRRLMALTHRLPPLAGVWHAAGVLADGLLPKQSALSLARVCGPKTHGGWALHLASLRTPLRTCALFSSAAALLGGAGQANYSSANVMLDALAVHRRTHGCTLGSPRGGTSARRDHCGGRGKRHLLPG